MTIFSPQQRTSPSEARKPEWLLPSNPLCICSTSMRISLRISIQRYTFRLDSKLRKIRTNETLNQDCIGMTFEDFRNTEQTFSPKISERGMTGRKICSNFRNETKYFVQLCVEFILFITRTRRYSI